MVEWRHHLHACPELRYEETETSDFVAAKLAELGIEVTRGLAGTGVVGTLRCGTSPHAIGLRADMDALPIEERNTFDYRSRHAGRMHACGHDGHTTMLLGAAAYLAGTRDFDGTVQFIFQPAEEAAKGAERMLDDGLFERFPVDSVYGMHNVPMLEANHFGIRPGPMMASTDYFEITVTGKGGHAGMPHLGHDPFVAVAQVLTALQAVPSRRIAATEALVISVTKVVGGTAFNVIPDAVVIAGTIRALDATVRSRAVQALDAIAAGIGSATETRIEVKHIEGDPAVVNLPEQTERAASAAATVVGADAVDRGIEPTMGGEDFSYMLQQRPGAYIWIGGGRERAPLHTADYDFNDAILVTGAAYWASLVRQELARG
ncbi:MAG: M20 aminoacylase family protein [Rhodanobacteraceae bacterium]